MIEKIIIKATFTDSEINTRYTESVNEIKTTKNLKDIIEQLQNINATEKFLSVVDSENKKISVDDITKTLARVNELKKARADLDNNEEISHKEYKIQFENYTKEISKEFENLKVLNKEVLEYEFNHVVVLENRSAYNTLFDKNISLKTTLYVKIA